MRSPSPRNDPASARAERLPAVNLRAPAIYRAATRTLGDWESALRAADVKAPAPARPSRPTRWTRGRIVEELRALAAEGLPLTVKNVRSRNSKLWTAAVRHFGSFSQATAAALASDVVTVDTTSTKAE